MQKDIDLLENVQRRATKIVLELRDLPYEDQLKAFKLTSLEERRKRGDMIRDLQNNNWQRKDKKQYFL